MKKLVFSLAFASLILASCSSDDDATTQEIPTGEISGQITTDVEYPLGNYTIQGTVTVTSTGSLRIAKGSTITANAEDGTADALLIKNGGQLFLEGEAALPIVFTEVSKTPGSWGGIIMFGDAPIVGASSVTSATSEDGNNLSYGGTNSTHNGGILKYVRVEYAGKKLTDNTSEMNCFSFYSVGSETVLENLVAYKGADDGFEFYGGTVSAKSLISYGNYDDSFDWQDGWRGAANTNWYAYQVNTGNYGMEIEAKSVNNSFGPVISNITLKRATGTVTEGGSSAAEYDAFQFKKEGNGEYSNVVIEGYTTSGATAVRIQDAGTNTNQVNGNKIKMLGMRIYNSTSQYTGVGNAFTVSFAAANYTTSTTSTGATLTAGAWANVDGVNLLANLAPSAVAVAVESAK